MDLVAAAESVDVTLNLFLTGSGDAGRIEHGKLPNRTFAGRVQHADLLSALDGYSRQNHDLNTHRAGTVCYVCGPPQMTDDFVEFLSQQRGIRREHVLCEKWW